MAGQPGAIHVQRAIAAGRRARLLVNSGALLISAAGSVIIHNTATPSDAADDGPAYPLISFSIFVLGVSLVLLAFVADRFPRTARVGVAIATAIHRYLFGLGW